MPVSVAAGLPAGLALDADFVCVTERVHLDDLRERLAESGGRSIPVVTEAGEVVGVLPCPPAASAGEHGETVADCMAKHVWTAHEQDSLTDVLTTMSRHRLRELVVVDERQAAVGILRDVDALRFVARWTR